MRFDQLADWLKWQERLHVKEIHLGLERSREVAANMGLVQPSYFTVSIAGTNGKGSSVAMLAAILSAQGYKVATYTSPHLIRYNERIKINGKEVSDQSLCEAFHRIDMARGDITLTYFEFGTLAALDLFQHADIDIAVLEVGLGGRLDAVNLVDADIALIAAVDIDHVAWLGDTRETIGREKAGIMRQGRAAVCSDPEPPASLVAYAHEIGSRLLLLHRDFELYRSGNEWSWTGASSRYEHLPLPGLTGDFQLYNAAGVLMVLEQMPAHLKVAEDAIIKGLKEVKLGGRVQIFSGPAEYILDVAHNPQAARELARILAARPVAGETHVLIGMLKDKDIEGIFRALLPVADSWHLTGLPPPRGANAEDLAAHLNAVARAPKARTYACVEDAARALRGSARAGDRVLVVGSFLTVAAMLRFFEAQKNAVGGGLCDD